MNRKLVGFLTGLFALVLAFCLTVLIWGSITGKTFTGVIKSWFPEEDKPAQTVMSDPVVNMIGSLERPSMTAYVNDIAPFRMSYVMRDGKYAGVQLTYPSTYSSAAKQQGQTEQTSKPLQRMSVSISYVVPGVGLTTGAIKQFSGTFPSTVMFGDDLDLVGTTKEALLSRQVYIFWSLTYADYYADTYTGKPDGEFYTFDTQTSSAVNPLGQSAIASGKLDMERTPTCDLPEEPVREGYTFVGWYYDPEFTRPYDGSPIYADTQLYAKMEINKYTVKFDVAGGDRILDKLVEWGSPVTLPDNPTREGYDFRGWTLDGAPYTDQVIKSDVTLTAVWEIKTYTVTFYLGGDVYKVVTVHYGMKLVDALDKAAMAYGYTVTAAKLGDQEIAVIASDVVSADMQITAEKVSAANSVGMFFAKNWWALLLVVVSAIGFGGSIAALKRD